MPIAHPESLMQRVNSFEHDIQRAFYSGYLCQHELKAQVVYLTIGVIGSVFITELCQNNNGVKDISSLNDYLLKLLAGIFICGLPPCLYCDGIFAVLPTILPLFTNSTPALCVLNLK